jgi:Uma2 family endonuclease
MTTVARATDYLTYADLQEIPDDGKRYELFDGDLVVSAAPAPRHQWVLINLVEQLLPVARSAGCRLMTAPLDFVFGEQDRTTLQPDIVILTPEQSQAGPPEGPYREPPLLAIEVLSPSTRVRDLRVKSRFYSRYAVPYLWYVDPDWPSITANRLQDGEYRQVACADESAAAFSAPPFDEHPLDIGRLFDWSR